MSKKKETRPKKERSEAPKAPKIIKIVVAVLLLIVMIPTMGTVWVKDGRKNPEYCAGCHQDPYYDSWADDDSVLLAHKHEEMGISCQTCHDRTVLESIGEIKDYIVGYEVPLPETQMSMDTCFTCHESYDNIIPLTDPAITGEERNPHAGHFGELECGVCHNMHRESVDYCSSCHNPVTNEEGWVKATQ